MGTAAAHWPQITMKITALPSDVLSYILRVTDQTARVSCLLACKALYNATKVHGSWPHVTFHDVDLTALEFMDHHRVSHVTITTATADDVAWFLGRMADQGIVCLHDLKVQLGRVHRVPSDLLIQVARHTGLTSLRLVFERIERSSEIFFPKAHAMTRLRTLEITETFEEDTKNLVVWFTGTRVKFPALEHVSLNVSVSDVLAGIPDMPCIKTMTYKYDHLDSGETFEDMRMGTGTLSRLALDVGYETEYAHLCRELNKTTLEELVLMVNDDHVDLTLLRANIGHLVFRMNVETADVLIDFEWLRQRTLRRLTVEREPWIEHGGNVHVLEIRHVNLPDWPDVARDVTMNLCTSCRLTLCQN